MNGTKQLEKAFIDHVKQEGFEPGMFSDGYDQDDGARYAEFLNRFLPTVGLTGWEIRMDWYTGGSNLVAERNITPKMTIDQFIQLERYDITHVLDNADEFDELVEDFISDLLMLADRVGITPTLTASQGAA